MSATVGTSERKKCAFDKHCDEYSARFVARDDLEKTIVKVVAGYDQAAAEEKVDRKKKHRQPDEDGWITVTSHRNTASKRSRQTDPVDPAAAISLKKTKLDPAFYASHASETKAKNLELLKERFEDDKKKLARAQTARKFRPDR